MRLVALKLENVRALSSKELVLEPRTVVLGDNGTGKSTIVEALRLLSVGKSFRTSRFDELLQFEKPYFRLTAKRANDKEQLIEFFYGQPFAEQAIKERVLTVNHKTTDWLSFMGEMPSVLFVPSDIEIVTGSPQVRRRYLDSILWQTSPEFRQDYLNFSRVLRERATVLFLLKIRRAGLDELTPWNELIARLTQSIRQKRLEYVEHLKRGLKGKKTHKLTFEVSYQPNDVELEAVQAQEISSSQNLYGPHRDELDILINGRSARRYASRGQARSAVMLLKVEEGNFLADRLGRPPLVLLDDIFSELDEENSRFLFEHLNPESQVVVTALSPQPLINDWPSITL